ncbi:glycosyltransferase family 2 protein [Pararhodonellum marinum]|uniref:glycosyltransferase family 2 protein n=1 Tax=Pararhodonellum marinum TaxID=2755358 RepID=UPI00188F20B0|nr:glycosyltransferase family 2 protein [Pararhodonellum marinum]
MGNFLVSIIIPNYNKAPYLRETLDSVLSQSFSEWECIIVDDHSSDNSWDILEEYISLHTRIKIYKRPVNRKQGGNAARNYAIELAKGEYVAFLDSDDIWQPSRLELAIGFLKSQNIESIYSGAIVVRPNSIEKLSSRDVRDGESVFDFILSDDVFCPTPSLIMKKELAQEIMFDEDLKRHQDYDFFINAHLISPWKYFENFDVQVNWTRADLKNINYHNCIPFYEKHWEKSINKNMRYKYIVRITSSSVRESFQYNTAAYFRDILEKEGYVFSFKEYILFYFPHLFYLLSKIKWFFLGGFSNSRFL